MSCSQENKRYSTIKKMRKLAMIAATMFDSNFLIIERSDGTFWYVKEGEPFKGEIIEYVFP